MDILIHPDRKEAGERKTGDIPYRKGWGVGTYCVTYQTLHWSWVPTEEHLALFRGMNVPCDVVDFMQLADTHLRASNTWEFVNPYVLTLVV